MSASEIDQQVFDMPSLEQGELTILLGAGASASSGLPDWSGMVSNLLLDSGTLKDRDVSELVCSTGDLVLLAESVHQQFKHNPNGWLQALSRALYRDAPRMPLSSSMQLNSALIACENPGKIHLATLNFDQLLEQAVTQAFLELEDELPPTSAAIRDQELRVEHLHGVIPYGTTVDVGGNTPTFSFFDYLLQLESDMPSAKLYLTQALKRGSLLIAGTSFRDPDMRQWLASILQNNARTNHKACILLAREGYKNINKDTFLKMRPALYSQWKALGFCPIFVNDFEDVAQLIRECPYIHSPAYQSPAQRIGSLWKHLTGTDVFKSAQNKFAEKLQRNIETLNKAISSTAAMNATLWIAHDDTLVRFASHDRVYIQSDLLRENETGFDSSYIAGRAYGSNSSIIITSEDNDFGRWKSIVAYPIVIKPRCSSWYTALPVGVLSFGIGEVTRESPELTNALTRMTLSWSELLENFVEGKWPEL